MNILIENFKVGTNRVQMSTYLQYLQYLQFSRNNNSNNNNSSVTNSTSLNLTRIMFSNKQFESISTFVLFLRLVKFTCVSTNQVTNNF